MYAVIYSHKYMHLETRESSYMVGSPVSYHIHIMDGALIHCSLSCLNISLVNAAGFFFPLFLCLPLHSSQTMERRK